MQNIKDQLFTLFKNFTYFIKTIYNSSNQGNITVLVFCLNSINIILALIALLAQTSLFKTFVFLILIISTITIIYTFPHMQKYLLNVKNLEDYTITNISDTKNVRVQLFYKLLENNLFEYHFQPIVNAKTGEIFAYEALMRTNTQIDMSPTEILTIASKKNKLYEIEKHTFTNISKIMMENPETFKSKKLFINSISSHQLSVADFDRLYEKYGTLFENVVMEITESTPLDEEGMVTLRNRLQDTNCQLALDDYGTGYSNESNLLVSNPNYVKIDRSILSSINIDSKKQHLVSNLVNFAARNNIKIIAEGIETYEEFEFVIHLGVDYIQGFYTAKPSPVLVPGLPAPFVSVIKDLNSKRELDTTKKIFEAKQDTTLSLVNLAFNQYTDLIIYKKELNLLGNNGMSVHINILVPDNMKCTLTLENVNLQGIDSPSISIGHNCSVIIKLIGDNMISYDGIRVPETSSLTFSGHGSLIVNSTRLNGVGIGGTAIQSYGNITFAGTGTIRVISRGEMRVGIGGAQNASNSLIHLISGNIDVETIGANSVGIGSIYGNALVNIEKAKVKIKSDSLNAVGIGCIKGSVIINSNGNIHLKCDGQNVIGIGSLKKGTGTVTILGGIIRMRYYAHNGSGIGSFGGNIDIDILNGDISIYSEGTNIVGIGDYSGYGEIRIQNGIISIDLHAAYPILIGNGNKTVRIDGGNIQCDFPKDFTIINTYGTQLIAKNIPNTFDFKQTIKTNEYSYDYMANYSRRFPSIRVYLPQDIQL
jgi:EAL domain-containing protein (putative c-di-GMP-specific phosphodiesterase class I)